MENSMVIPFGQPLLFLPYWHGTGYFLLLRKSNIYFLSITVGNYLATDSMFQNHLTREIKRQKIT
jgi:hypothetical protein